MIQARLKKKYFQLLGVAQLLKLSSHYAHLSRSLNINRDLKQLRAKLRQYGPGF